MSRQGSDNLRWPAVVLIIAILPLIVVLAVLVVIFRLIMTIGLYILVWTMWCTRGKDILFVYSDSPIWHDYIEQQIIPQIEARAVILNWSDRRHWLHRYSLPS